MECSWIGRLHHGLHGEVGLDVFILAYRVGGMVVFPLLEDVAKIGYRLDLLGIFTLVDHLEIRPLYRAKVDVLVVLILARSIVLQCVGGEFGHLDFIDREGPYAPDGRSGPFEANLVGGGVHFSRVEVANGKFLFGEQFTPRGAPIGGHAQREVCILVNSSHGELPHVIEEEGDVDLGLPRAVEDRRDSLNGGFFAVIKGTLERERLAVIGLAIGAKHPGELRATG